MLSVRDQGVDKDQPNLPTIAFNISKKEQYTPSNGFKTLQRRLRGHFKVTLFKEDMSLPKLVDVNLIVFGAPREKFSTAEFTALKGFLERGGSILYMTGEGGESAFNTNFNYLLEEYGMTVNPGGKLFALGSAQMFSDAYIDKEENGKLFDVIIQFLTKDTIILNSIDANEPDISDYHYLPETAKLSETLRSCLQESEDLPKDFTTLFDTKLFKFDTSLIPQAVHLYGHLGLKHEPLTLIQPQFETPLPPLEPAVFPPILQEIPPPALDLFDLDEHFASEKAKLAQLTNKCSDDDLEYYMRECGQILGIMEKLEPGKQDARHVLDHVFKSIVNWKKLNQV
ncbi:Intraflagellar transport protein 52 [Boothiomyces sp. JEL0866]|nr:Intraflagellar transport protein 52 [Boothiomyces sp. JEL0866]